MSRKSINLTNEEDVQQWKRIKLNEIDRRENPDLGDIDLLRDMMDNYEQGGPGPPSPGVSAVADDKVMVRFLEDYDEPFTGVDLREYGPFEEGDILRMPKANAEILESWDVIRWFGPGPDD